MDPFWQTRKFILASFVWVAPEGYAHFKESCVPSSNIILFHDFSVQECADLCDSNSQCLGFEYGMNYGGSRYNARDCQPQSSADYQVCNGTTYNLDFYKKITRNTSLFLTRKNHSKSWYGGEFFLHLTYFRLLAFDTFSFTCIWHIFRDFSFKSICENHF